MFALHLNHMLRHTTTLMLCGIVALTLGACSEREAMAKVERAESIMAENPEEALDIVAQVDNNDIHSKHGHARYALVYSEALYHNYIDIQSDTLVRPMMEYYMRSDRHSERARALYQYALVAHTAQREAEAMVMLSEAKESLRQAPDTKLEGLVHRAMADIYSNGCLFANALEAYAEARACFDSLGLEYHSASALYDMGGTLIQLRDFEGAEEALRGALEYGIAAENMEFTCAVLHELLDLAIYRDDYADCRHYLAEFERHGCLLYGEAHHAAIRAMVLAHKGAQSDALALVSEAEGMADVEWADIEYARYIIYRNTGDAEKALYWQERSKHAQDRLMIEVLEQPVLNVEIDLLRERLDAEERERDLVRQRNIILFIAIGIAILLAALYIVQRMRKKSRELNRYIEMVSELQDALKALPRETAASVGALYRDRFHELNELCDIYYDHGGSTRNKNMIFNKLTETIEAIKNDERRLKELEEAVNKYRDDVMRRLKEQVPKLNERDTRVALYVFAGFSNRAIAIFIDSDPVAVSKLRYNIKQKIKSAACADGEMLIAALSDK